MNPYDRVRYPSVPFPHTHPSASAALARLYGLEVAPPGRCRVLDVGSGDGANLISMAANLPDSEFVGIDLAGEPIARGQANIQEFGLRNVRLLQMNLMDFDQALGQFDYVIAHGFYSWVPPVVQDRLLSLCSEILTPGGIANISYNVLPGGHVRELVRDLMHFHTAELTDATARVTEGINILRLVANSKPQPEPYQLLVQSEYEAHKRRSVGAIFHDEFSSEYHQVYFRDFAAHARRHNLDYVCEAALADNIPHGFKQDAIDAARSASGGDRIRWEQYLDFIRFRKFRRTLLCRAGRRIAREPDAARISALYASSLSRRSGPGEFTSELGAVMRETHPVVAKVLGRIVDAWPVAVATDELIAMAPGVEKLLVDLAAATLIEIHAWAPPAVADPGDRPYIWPLARWQARQGTRVANLYHREVEVSGDLARRLLQLADGTRSRDDLAAALGRERAELDGQLQTLVRLAVLATGPEEAGQRPTEPGS